MAGGSYVRGRSVSRPGSDSSETLMRILLGLTEVSGFFARLKQGFDELGVEAVHVSLQPHRFSYSGKVQAPPRVVAWAQYTVAQRLRAARSAAPGRAFWLAAVIFTRLLLFAWALGRFDVFILGAGSSFFSFRELPLLRLLGKKVIYTLHGTDSRPPYIDGFFDPAQYGLPVRATHASEIDTPRQRAERFALAYAAIARQRRRQVQTIERNTVAVLCGPSYSHFLTRPFVSFYAVGVPTSAVQGISESRRPLQNGQVRILHAPSELRGKGTHEIRSAIATLQARNLPIEYVEISDRPNAEVMAEIARCDMVIDQLYSDTPMASFAAEAGLLSKPAVVGGYYSASVRGHVPADQIPPTAFCHPDKLADTVAALVTDPAARAQLGADAQRFVMERWDAKVVASRFLQILDGVPPAWLIYPHQVTYLHGAGLSESQASANVAALISLGGVEALQLSHRPDLERLFAHFAEETDLPC